MIVKKNHKHLSPKDGAEIQVAVEFIVTIKEVHSRTETICEEQSTFIQCDFGVDFEKARRWLESEHTLAALASFSAEACDRWATTAGGKS